MSFRDISALGLLLGLGVLLITVLVHFPFSGSNLTGVGSSINALAAKEIGTANIVTSVLLAYRGLDTLGELMILFVAATAAGMVLAQSPEEDALSLQKLNSFPAAGFVLRVATHVLFPFLLLLGAYIIIHGHLTPGGGFQGGAILAAAFFIPVLTTPAGPFAHQTSSLVEGLAGSSFIIIGLLALFGQGSFLAPLGSPGVVGELFSAGSVPLLSAAIGIKVGSELAGLLARFIQA